MMKIAAILAFAGCAAAGVIAPQYAQVQYAQPAVYAQQTLVKSVAQPIAYAQPLLKTVAPVVKQVAVAPEPFDPHPQYNYGYSVSDALTGDSKSAHESRDGDVVQGQYSLVEPDGSIRTVTYTADAINGFNAVVDRQAPAVAVQKVVKTVQPVQYAQPLVKTLAQPLAYASPVVKTIASPVAYASYGAPAYAKAIAPAYLG
ncbi:Cuticle protein 19.8 [Orchesella cincta]|uniref:Cuticle protein 19.8 n=1 Tax=Orchesella cincta TaxID=48709 RepID=A0A1D2MR12_ORCCI|nr:Cuticle protein 19.8 [Orchesella cincta]